MKPGSHKERLSWRMLLVIVLVFGLATEGLAADPDDNWRATYDLVMRWVNFLILAAIIVKFGRRPLMSFLSGRKEEIEYELRRLEEEKEAVLQKVSEMRQQIEENEIRYEQIKERFVSQGQNRKQAIIDEARLESRILLEGTKNLIDNRLRSAKQKLRAEIIDLAVEKAMQKLPELVTDEDNRRLLDYFLKRAVS